jgi:hypothetical protein
MIPIPRYAMERQSTSSSVIGMLVDEYASWLSGLGEFTENPTFQALHRNTPEEPIIYPDRSTSASAISRQLTISAQPPVSRHTTQYQLFSFGCEYKASWLRKQSFAVGMKAR